MSRISRSYLDYLFVLCTMLAAGLKKIFSVHAFASVNLLVSVPSLEQDLQSSTLQRAGANRRRKLRLRLRKTTRTRGCSQNPVLPVAQVLSYIQGMSIDQVAAEALRLPPNQRAMLAESLWESLTDPFKLPAESDDAEAIALALERDRQLEAGEVAPLSHEELKSRLRRGALSITRPSRPS
jgi:hypothetical protein